MLQKLAIGLTRIYPHKPMSGDVAVKIAEQSIKQAGPVKDKESSGDYAYRLACIAQAKKQKHFDGVV